MLDLTNLLSDSVAIATVRLFTMPNEVFKVTTTKDKSTLIISDAINSNTDKLFIVDGDTSFIVNVVKLTQTGAIVEENERLKTLSKDARLGIPKVYEAYPDELLPEKFYQRMISSNVDVYRHLPLDLQNRYMEGETITRDELMSRLVSEANVETIIEMMSSSPKRQSVEARFQMPDGLLKYFPVMVTDQLNTLLNDYKRQNGEKTDETDDIDPK